MSGTLSVPLKRGADINIEKPLTDFLVQNFDYRNNDVDCSKDVKDFQTLRNSAIKNLTTSENSMESLMKYFDTLVALEMKISDNELSIPFKWKDAFAKKNIFRKSSSLTVPNILYEKVEYTFITKP